MKITTLITTTLALCTLHSAKAQDDPFAKSQDDPFAPAENGATNAADALRPLSFTYEVFSLSRAEAAKLFRAGPADDKLYETMIEMVDQEQASQEAFAVTRGLPGQRITNDSGTEAIYPTEWDPAQLPMQVGVAITTPPTNDSRAGDVDAAALKEAPRPDQLPTLLTPAKGTSFETRITGLTLQMEAARSAESGLIELRMELGHVHLAGRESWGQGPSTLETPIFEIQNLNVSTVVRPDVPHLLGTLNPPSSSEAGVDPKRQVWFAFVTVSLVN